MWARVPWSQGGCWHPKMVMAQGQLHFGGTVVVRRAEMCLCRTTAAPVSQNGPQAQSLGTVPRCGPAAQHLGIAPLYGPQARYPTLIPRHHPPEHCPTRWLLLLPPSSAPSWAGMQPTGPGKEHQPPSSPTSLSPQPLHQPPFPSGTLL